MKLFKSNSPSAWELLKLAVHDEDIKGAVAQIKKGADVCQNHNELLLFAVTNRDINMVMLLVTCGANISENNNEAVAIARSQSDHIMIDYLEVMHRMIDSLIEKLNDGSRNFLSENHPLLKK